MNTNRLPHSPNSSMDTKTPARGRLRSRTRFAHTSALALAALLILGTGQTRAHDEGLTKQERAQGWRLLFNGRDAVGWANRGDTEAVGWGVEDGALVLKKPGSGDLVYTTSEFEDFELSIDWKTEGNSGLFLRMSDQEDWLNTGMEVQILPTSGTTVHSTGDLYDLVPPPASAKVRQNDWNNFRVVCKGPRVSCELNGVQTFEIDLRDDRWKTPQGKFAIPYSQLPRKGWIMLQDHGARVAFRNIRIRPIGR